MKITMKNKIQLLRRWLEQGNTIKKSFCVSLILSSMTLAHAGEYSINAGDLTIDIDTSGLVTGLKDLSNNDHNVSGKKTALFSLIVENNTSSSTSAGATAHYNPTGWTYDPSTTTYKFTFNDGIAVDVKLNENSGYATLEVVSITNTGGKDIRDVLWGPLTTDIVELVGDQVGVVSNRDFAIGMLGTNAKTEGGFPAQYPAIGFIEQAVDLPIDADGKKVDAEKTRNGRQYFAISRARLVDFGSILQSYSRDYTKTRTFNPWEWGNKYIETPVPALTGNLADYGKLEGSKVAIFGVARSETINAEQTLREIMAEQVLDRIGQIEVGEGMPHPIIAGVWSKKSEKANSPYLVFVQLSDTNMSSAMSLANDIGVEGIYRNTRWGLFNSGGDFTVKNEFGGSDSGLSASIQNAKNYHLTLGSHSLSSMVDHENSVAKADRRGLAYRGIGNLVSDITDSSETLAISPVVGTTIANLEKAFPAPSSTDDTFLILIDDELIEYTGSLRWGNILYLTGLQRSQYSTAAVYHTANSEVRNLWQYGRNSPFIAGLGMMVNTIAPRLSSLLDLDIGDFSFDGYESALLAGYDSMGLSLFSESVYNGLSDKTDFKNDASFASPYNWHLNSRYNWGETEDNITRAHQKYRWANEVYFARNYLPPMMGWWNIDDMDEWRWALARAASFDGGFAYYGNEYVNTARYSSSDRSEIRGWLNAQQAGSFDWANRFLMREADEYFKLDSISRTGQVGPSWKLSDYNIDSNQHSFSRYIAPQMSGHPLTNIARNATVTASSQLDNGFNPAMTVDTFTGVGDLTSEDRALFTRLIGSGEWVSSAFDTTPWVKLSWDSPQRIRQIMLFDRENTVDNIVSGTLNFSDGSTINVDSLDHNGDAKVIDFAEKSNITWVRFTITASSSYASGLAEFVVIGTNEGHDARNLAINAIVSGVEDPSAVNDSTISSGNATTLNGTGTGNQAYAVLDLGAHFMLGGLNVWHDDPNTPYTYKDVLIEVSEFSDFRTSVKVFNNDMDNSLGRGIGSDAVYQETGMGKLIKFAPTRARYVRLWSNGNNVDNNNRLVEVEVYGVGDGAAYLKDTSVTSSSIPSTGSLDNLTDKQVNTSVDLGTGEQWVQLDLGSIKTVNSLVVARDNAGMRTYHDVVMRLSTDPNFIKNVNTVFNNDGDNSLLLGHGSDSEYQETDNGRFVRFAPVRARYVRLYSNGSNYDDNNNYREVIVGTAKGSTVEPPVPQTGLSLIKPTSVRQTQGNTFSGFDLVHLIDGSGFISDPNINNYQTEIHSAAMENLWVTKKAGFPNYFSGSNPDPQMVFTLGKYYSLSSIAIWGYGGNSNEASNFALEFSTDGGSTYGNIVYVNTSGLLVNSCESMPFGQNQVANTVRVTMINNAKGVGFGSVGGDRVGLGEVRFVGVPIADSFEVELVTPTVITQLAGNTYTGFDTSHLIDNIGLTNLNATAANYANVTHTASRDSLWVTKTRSDDYYFDGLNPNPQFIVNLDKHYFLESLVVWGYGGNTNEGSNFTVEFSDDGGTSYYDFVNVQTSALLGVNQETLTFTYGYRANAVRITITDNAGGRGFPGVGGDRVGLGEIKFLTGN